MSTTKRKRNLLESFLASPKGRLAVVAAVIVTVVVASGSSPADAPEAFVATLVVAWLVLWALERVWEDRMRPAVPPYARRPPTDQVGMLRRDPNAHFFRDHGGFLFTKRYFFVGTCLPPLRVDKDFYNRVNSQHQLPVPVAHRGQRTWWKFEGQFYWDSEQHDAKDVMALVRDRERRATKKLERAHVLMNLDQDPRPRRAPIPREVRQAVFQRDGGQCVECGSTFDLQYDHILPVALGGATSVANLQLLCSQCNQEKSDSI